MIEKACSLSMLITWINEKFCAKCPRTLANETFSKGLPANDLNRLHGFWSAFSKNISSASRGLRWALSSLQASGMEICLQLAGEIKKLSQPAKILLCKLQCSGLINRLHNAMKKEVLPAVAVSKSSIWKHARGSKAGRVAQIWRVFWDGVS